MNSTYDQRRYDLDWLRVIAFGLLIFYHIGMYYVTWGYHVKSPYLGEFLEPVMILLNPWRLPLLFVISGVAVSFAAEKLSNGAFALARFRRLMIPFLFGIFFIVPPQTYYELLTGGVIEPGYWNFYEGYIDFHQRWEVITPTYNHLWYVLYVLIYTMLLIPFLGLMRNFEAGPLLRRIFASPFVLILPAVPFIIYRFTSDMDFPETHIVWEDWGAHIRYATYFVLGAFIAKSGLFWQAIARHRKLALLQALSAAAVLAIIRAYWLDEIDPEGAFLFSARALRILYIWWVICALFGLAQHYLHRPSERLSYLTEAVFPYYILHQTILIVAGVYLSSLALGAVAEFILLVIATGAGCALLHEYIIRRVAVLRPLFGLKNIRKPGFGDHRPLKSAERVEAGK